jgi:site-specific DNA-cytosine methylase
MRILSLFDGMSCGVLAMMESGVPIDRYVAYEIDKYAIQTSTHNFPFIEQRGDVFKADFTEFEGFDWLIGGSPCTYWSIAQTNNRETTASGMGWELFSQYVRALHEAKPKYFIYENNKSMSKDIRRSIDEAFGFEAVLINSALLSAQNRQRLYWVGRRNDDGTYSKVDVPQPQDRGILLKDVLEDGCCVDKDKAYCLKHQAGNARDYFKKHHTQIKYEPVFTGEVPEHKGTYRNGKSATQCACGGGLGGKTGLYAVPVCHTIPQEVRVRKYECDISKFQELLRSNKRMSNREIAEALGRPQTEVEHWFRTDKYFNVPDADIWFDLKALLKIDSTEFDDYVTVFEERDGVFDKANRCYDINGKMSTVMTTANDNVIVPVNTTVDGKAVTLKSQYYKNGMANLLNDTSKGGKYSASGVAEQVGCKTIENAIPDIVDKYGHLPEMFNAYNRAEIKDKAPTLSTGSMHTSSCAVNCIAKIPCFAVPVEWDEEGRPTKARSCADGKIYTVYEVKDGKITIKDKEYPIKLPDGFYIIRKLTVRECMRLQTVPEWYEFPVSDSQAYKMLGNGWTVLVISWLIDCTLR